MDQVQSVFSFQATKDGRVFISWKGATVTILKGNRAAKFLDDILGADDELAQLEMARITGNFKRGNERLIGRRKAQKEMR